MKSTGEGESPPFDTSYQGGAQLINKAIAI
jgi:hypothetical protein